MSAIRLAEVITIYSHLGLLAKRLCFIVFLLGTKYCLSVVNVGWFSENIF